MRHALYRHFDAEGALLYVGMTGRVSSRDKEHMRGDDWFGDVSHSTSVWYDAAELALEAERKAILTEKPRHNIRKDVLPLPTQPTSGWRGALAKAVSKSGMSRRAVSLKAGQSAGYVHGILVERKDPTVERFIALCAVINVDPVEILSAEPAKRGAA